MDCHLHITAYSPPCDHIKIALHRSSDNVALGFLITTKLELREELQSFDSGKDKAIAQIQGIVLANPGLTPAQLKTLLEDPAKTVIRI